MKRTGVCKSNQKNIPVVGFLTCNDCDVLRAKTGGYRLFTHRTIIPPTTCTIFIHPSLSIQHTFNPFHVYMYISHWGSERQSPSLEIIFDPLLTCTGVHPLSGWTAHMMKEVGTGGPT